MINADNVHITKLLSDQMELIKSTFIIFILLLNSFVLAKESGFNDQMAEFRDKLTPNELVWLDNNKSLSYVYDPDWAPFEWKNEINRHTGIIADIITILKQRTGIELIPIKTDSWAESVKLVKNGKADMFSAITINSERKKYLNFSSNDIYTYPATLLTTFDDETVYLDITKDCVDKKIGIVASSGLGKYIKINNPELNFVEVNSTKEGFDLLGNKEIDLFAINAVTAKYYIEKKGYKNLKVALKLDFLYHLKVAMHQNIPIEAISIIDKALISISRDEFNNIFNKWTEITVEKRTNWALIIQILSGAFLIIGFFIWNTRRINLIVKEKTKTLSLLNKELSELASIDVLTGIPNRREYNDRLQVEVANAKRTNLPLTLMMIDIDWFKKYNDHYGHDKGDESLKSVSKKIRESLPRSTDFVARYGGEEFVVLLPSTSHEGAFEVANLIRSNIELLSIENIESDNKVITVSIGVTTLTGAATNEIDLLKQADIALYQAKNSGRNQVKLFKI